jgi:hypothetical protein
VAPEFAGAYVTMGEEMTFKKLVICYIAYIVIAVSLFIGSIAYISALVDDYGGFRKFIVDTGKGIKSISKEITEE